MHLEIDSLNIVDIFDEMVQKFPGLIDGEQDVNGADLVDFLSTALVDYRAGKEGSAE